MKRLVTLGLLIAALGLGGCAQRQQTSMRSHGKEYFPEFGYGRASPRVVAEGEEVPKGGGQYLVENPIRSRDIPMCRASASLPEPASRPGMATPSTAGAPRTAKSMDKDFVSGAHPTMPLPSYARVTNLRNHHSIIVRVNDRGPYHDGRIMDLSSRAAEALGYRHIGTARVKVEYVGNASLGGSDDKKLLATLRVDGRPAQLDDFSLSPTMVAERRELPEERPAPTQAVRDIERVAMIQPESAPQAPPRADYVAVNQPPPPKRPALAPPLKPEELAPATGPVAQLPEHPPAPPQRPFDLGTIPGADTPIRVSRR